jgi:hypothetical protein
VGNRAAGEVAEGNVGNVKKLRGAVLLGSLFLWSSLAAQSKAVGLAYQLNPFGQRGSVLLA